MPVAQNTPITIPVVLPLDVPYKPEAGQNAVELLNPALYNAYGNELYPYTVDDAVANLNATEVFG